MFIQEEIKKITEPIHDIMCDNKWSVGQTLTILKHVKVVLDRYIKDCEETVERNTGG